MHHIEIKKNLFWVGTNDRSDTDLFEGLWPLPDGVTYNSYLLKGEKNVLIDLVRISTVDEFFATLSQVLDLETETLDYIVLNHMEPDHSSALIKQMLKYAPDVKFIISEKAKDMLAAFYEVTDHIKVVEDGETLDIGDFELQFVMTPWVHWPETMVTYETKNQILFSCDAFGSYGAFKGCIFDDEYTEQDLTTFLNEAKRYYANIVTKYSRLVLRAIDKLKDVPVKMVAPSHGVVWRKHPERIIKLYQNLAEYGSSDAGEDGVTVIYGSMYGSTETMMNAIIRGIRQEGLPVYIHDASRVHVSYILTDLLLNKGVLIGAPTYEGDIFHPVKAVLDVTEGKRIQYKKAAYFGSYSWSGGSIKKLEAMSDKTKLRWEVIDTLGFKGRPTEDEIQKGIELGRKLAKSIKA